MNVFDYQVYVAAEVEDFSAATKLASGVVQDFHEWLCVMRPDMEFRRVDTRTRLVAFIQVSDHNIAVRVQNLRRGDGNAGGNSGGSEGCVLRGFCYADGSSFEARGPARKDF